MAERTKADRQAAAKKGEATKRRNAAHESGDDAKQSAKSGAGAALSSAKSLGDAVKHGYKSVVGRVGAGRKGR